MLAIVITVFLLAVNIVVEIESSRHNCSQTARVMINLMCYVDIAMLCS